MASRTQASRSAATRPAACTDVLRLGVHRRRTRRCREAAPQAGLYRRTAERQWHHLGCAHLRQGEDRVESGRSVNDAASPFTGAVFNVVNGDGNQVAVAGVGDVAQTVTTDRRTPRQSLCSLTAVSRTELVHLTSSGRPLAKAVSRRTSAQGASGGRSATIQRPDRPRQFAASGHQDVPGCHRPPTAGPEPARPSRRRWPRSCRGPRFAGT